MSGGRRPKVLVAAPSHSPEQKAILSRAGFDITIVDRDIEAQLERLLPSMDALCLGMSVVTREMLEAAPNLMIVARQGTGTDTVDTAAADDLGIWVTNTPGANSRAVAEFAFGGLIAAARRITLADRRVKAGEWRSADLFGPELAGHRAAIVGLGKIGGLVAEMCRAAAIKVVAYDPFAPDERFGALGVERSDDLLEAAAGTDFLMIHASTTDSSAALVGRDVLARLNRGAVVVNVARASVVDQDALYDELESQRISAAVLDVFPEEPPHDRRLADHPRVIATPHTAAWSYEARTTMTVRAAEEVVRCVQTGVPQHPVNAPAHPRSSAPA